MPADPFRRYTRTLALLFGSVLTVVVLFTMSVDPFGVWRNLGLSEGKRPAVTWSRIAAAERLKGNCDLALVGSSRIVYGYGTRLPRIVRMRPCNGALGGTSIVEIEKVFDLILDQTDIGAIILFVDLHMFHDKRGYNHDFAQSLLNADRTPVSYYAWTLTSLTTLEYATRSVGLQLPIFAPPRPPRPSFALNRASLRITLLNDGMYRRFEAPHQTLDIFRGMLDDAQRHGVKLMVVIPASHAMELEAEHTAGLWELNRDWRRFLVEETAKRDIPLWDFATYHSPAKAPVPLAPRDKESPYWSDINHQSQLLGRLTLERITDALLGRPGEWEPGFGVRLTPANVEEHLEELDRGRLAWREEQPAQAAWFDSVIAELKADDPTVAEDWEVNLRRSRGERISWRDHDDRVAEQEDVDF